MTTTMQTHHHTIPEDVLAPMSPPMRDDVRRVLDPRFPWHRQPANTRGSRR